MEQIKKIPKVLVACEESQAVTIELRKLGIEAYSCDMQVIKDHKKEIYGKAN